MSDEFYVPDPLPQTPEEEAALVARVDKALSQSKESRLAKYNAAMDRFRRRRKAEFSQTLTWDQLVEEARQEEREGREP